MWLVGSTSASAARAGRRGDQALQTGGEPPAVVTAHTLRALPCLEEDRLERAARARPDLAGPSLDLAHWLERVGRFERAEAAYRGALLADPACDAARHAVSALVRRRELPPAAPSYTQQILKALLR